jgi:2-polyprenyl-6-methoxyphenol hydroxylase-like FAD-dependent oxidoreductase
MNSLRWCWLILQPAGLAVFEHLGVLDQALKLGAKVTGLEGQLADKRLLVNSHYHRRLIIYGLGIHRATLCHVLTEKLAEYSSHVTWRMSHNIEKIEEQPNEVRFFGSPTTILR